MTSPVCFIMIKDKLKRFNLNQAINSARANKFAAAKKKKDLETDLMYLLRPLRDMRLNDKYKVCAHWLVPGLSADLDNLMLKSVFDAMQTMGVLKNDDMHHIVEINHTFENVKIKDQGVIIKFYEVAQNEKSM